MTLFCLFNAVRKADIKMSVAQADRSDFSNLLFHPLHFNEVLPG